MLKIKRLRNSILGGMMIGLGCIAYLGSEDKTVGAFLFSLGLLTILILHWTLFTGVLCRRASVSELITAFCGNYIGIFLTKRAYTFTFDDKAAEIGKLKAQRPLYETFILAVLCEICIFVAVKGYEQCKAITIMAVMVFILCGFEHCIADLFYSDNLPFILTVVFGNTIGSLIMRCLHEIP